MARTQQWATGDAKRARASDHLLQFLSDHNVGWKDLHGVLVAYFKQELPYDTMETSALLRPSLGHRDRASSSSAEEVQDFMSWVPPEFSFPAAIASVCPSLGRRDRASSSSAEEVQDFMSWVPPELSFPAASINISEFLPAPPAEDSEDAVGELGGDTYDPLRRRLAQHGPRQDPLAQRGEEAPAAPPAELPQGDTEVQLGPSLERDIDALLRDGPYKHKTSQEWCIMLDGLTSEDIPFNVFGVSRTHYDEKSGLNPPTAASSSSAAASASELPRLGIWGNIVSHQRDDSSDDACISSKVKVTRPATLFEHRPGRLHDKCLAKIQSMRDQSYFIENGFRWATGSGKSSSGVRVRWRYEQAGYLNDDPAMPSIEELHEFAETRFPEFRVVDGPIEAMAPDALLKGFGGGKLYRMHVSDAPLSRARQWHGSNLYVIESVLRTGLRNQIPASGNPPGVYSFNDARAHKMAYYSYHVLSGTGCAWTAFAELAIDPLQTAKFGDQHVTDEAGVCLVALWFHGVSQKDFTEEYIWPLWEPGLEVPIVSAE